MQEIQAGPMGRRNGTKVPSRAGARLLGAFHAVRAAYELGVADPPAVHVVPLGRAYVVAAALVGVLVDARAIVGNAVALAELCPVGGAAFALAHRGAGAGQQEKKR